MREKIEQAIVLLAEAVGVGLMIGAIALFLGALSVAREVPCC